jgi:hypothetical protein
MTGLSWTAMPVHAIDLPDSTPVVEQIDVYRNCIETGDYLAIIYENTPYTSTPTVNYGDAFIWRFYDTDGTTVLGQATGYAYNEGGYGYNVISFYFAADDAPTWGQEYTITLTGVPQHFDSPPQYTYNIVSSDYSSFTVQSDVQDAIASRVIEIAIDLTGNWNVAAAYSLTAAGETGTVLSIYGQSFFRGAIYGLQAIAPKAFELEIGTIDADPRTWTTTYVTELAEQYEGNYIEDAEAAGEDFLNVSYNLMGMLVVATLAVVIIFGNWRISGGNKWNGFVEAVPVLVIGSRMALIGLGEVGLIAALCWIFSSGKIWKVW